MSDRRVAIIGAGIGGLAAAARLAAAGCHVTVFETAAQPGGKLRTLNVGGRDIDSGPTVLTMRWVFEELFDACGASFTTAVQTTPLAILARHAWTQGGALDLFADRAQSFDAIASFAGKTEAQGYQSFCRRARQTYEALEHSFIRADRPTPISLTLNAGLRGLPALARISPFTTYWRALHQHFRDPRLRQLFARYATYCGASPMSAPATLMLVAHVEQEGVWTIAGGMHHLAQSVAALAQSHGAAIRTNQTVTRIETTAGRATAIHLASGERHATDAIIANTDAAALTTGLFGPGPAKALRTDPARSLSALTWSLTAAPTGFPLSHHTVIFSADCEAEFAEIAQGAPPTRPTIYICAADRTGTAAPPQTPERLFCIMNAPANGDRHAYTQEEVQACETAMTTLFQTVGLQLNPQQMTATTPTDFARLFPATGGALYGPATHGPFASFRRPASRTNLPGLYLAGGSVHPGPGVPMAALSGRLAAASVLQDFASTSQSRKTVTAGGTSTR